MSAPSRPIRCAWCRQPAVALCEARTRWIDPDGRDEDVPCHLPLCEAHRGELDGRDCCPTHLKLLAAPAETLA